MRLLKGFGWVLLLAGLFAGKAFAQDSSAHGQGLPLTAQQPDAAPPVPQPALPLDNMAPRRSLQGDFLSAALPSQHGHAAPVSLHQEFVITPEVEYYLERYRGSRNLDWMVAALVRAKPYEAFIRKTLADYGLPPELYYLPVIESQFRTSAYSRSGAAGLWQFMKNSTGQWMRITEWLDERRDFWKATVGAAEKLRSNYRITGSWLIALAAYNAGLGRMQAIIKKAGTSDFWELSRRNLLPRETRAYVPHFIAVAHTAARLGRLGAPLSWDEPVEWVRIKLGQPVDLRILAQNSGISWDALKQANAELVYPITPPSGEYHLKVQAKDQAAVEAALRDPQVKLLKVQVHTITSGDTIYGLSKRYGVPESLILRYNPGIRPSALRLNAKLIIPQLRETVAQQPAPRAAEAPAPVSEAGQTAPAVAPGSQTVPPASITVARGDTLWSISRRLGCSVEALAAANGLRLDAVLALGTVLRRPQ